MSLEVGVDQAGDLPPAEQRVAELLAKRRSGGIDDVTRGQVRKMRVEVVHPKKEGALRLDLLDQLEHGAGHVAGDHAVLHDELLEATPETLGSPGHSVGREADSGVAVIGEQFRQRRRRVHRLTHLARAVVLRPQSGHQGSEARCRARERRRRLGEEGPGSGQAVDHGRPRGIVTGDTEPVGPQGVHRDEDHVGKPFRRSTGRAQRHRGQHCREQPLGPNLRDHVHAPR